MKKHRVAIAQPRIIKGGRLQVIIGITRTLNRLGIIPELISFHFGFDIDEIHRNYGSQVQLTLRQIKGIRTPQDFSVLLFHTLLRNCKDDYDLIINTSNSLVLIPAHPTFLTYMFYPRKSRIFTDSVDIHLPDEPVKPFTRQGIEKFVLRWIYNRLKFKQEQPVICMTEFTYETLRQVHHVPDNYPIIYPAVETTDYQPHGQQLDRKKNQIISVGRFTPNKRQLEQVILAKKLPDYEFYIVGFIANQAYYDRCVKYIEENQLTNVHLNPNLEFSNMIALMQQSKYFLHTMIKEPFGITAIQAVAAGCVPIIHDSGGQRETIILPELRYNEIDDVPDMIKRLEALPDTEIKAKIEYLKTHVENTFSEEVFQSKMENYLHQLLI